jgi:archaellum biogenesis ATPase FlaH
MAKKFEHLQAPAALRELKGWLVWRWVRRPDRPKALKMPYYVSGPVRKHAHGTPEDRALLVTFEEAKRVADLHDFAGVGLALMPEFGITALDFDNCVANGVIDPRVEQLTIGTYAELSPSGTGVRAFMRGESPDSKDSTPADNSFGFETFHGKGFVTFTGDVTDTTELTGDENTVAPLSDAVKAFCATRFKRLERVRAECVGAGKPTFGMSPEQITELLNKLPDDLTYDEWRNVGMAVHHETEGDGFDIWDEWSSRSPKYTSSAYGMERWVSFGRNASAEYTTMGSVLLMIRDSGGETGLEVASPDEFEALPMPVGGRFNIRSHSDFASQVRSVSWIVKDFLPKATLGVLFGESGSGKTFASYDLCAAVCRGIEWNGKRVTKGRVLYVVAEGVAGFVNRIKAYCHQQGIKPSDVDMDVISDLTPNLLEPAQITDLIKDIKKQEPYDLIVMDTFAQVMPGANENSGEDVGKALAECKRIHRHTGAMVLLVHHSGKDASKGARGWSGLRAAADVELEVLRSDELRSISVTKLKDGQDGANIGFKLHTVILGEDEDGDDITSCIVEYTNTGRATKEKGTTVGPKERQILMVLNEVFGLGTDQKMALPELIEAAAAQLAPPIGGKRDNRKRDVSRCIDSLSAKNYLFVEDGMVKLPENDNA